MVLQGETRKRQSAVIDVVDSIVQGAAPQYAAVTSEVSSIIRAILAAQPDVTTFDFEATLMSDQPEDLIKVVDVQGFSQAGMPDASKSQVRIGWNRRIPWLKYGGYAVVETRRHGERRAVLSATDERRMHFDGGWISLSEGATSGDGQRVDTNYLVFTITPHQLSQQDAVLAAASKANRALVSSLIVTDADITKALEDIATHSKQLSREIIKVRAEREAQRIARVKRRFDTFKPLFESVWGAAVATLPAEQKTLAEAIGKAVLARWELRFSSASDSAEDLKKPADNNTASQPPKDAPPPPGNQG
jgi:hypothetical protein